MLTFLDNIPTVVRYILIGAIAVAISLLHPNPSPFRYEFEKGQAWRHADVVAPNEFAIEKPLDEINRDLKRIKSESPRFCQLIGNVEPNLIKHFEEQYSQALHDIHSENKLPITFFKDSTRYLNLGKTLLHRVYERGILQPSDSLLTGSNYGVKIVYQNVVEQRASDQLYDIDEAARYFRDTLSLCKLPDVVALYPLLKEALQPNVVYSDSITKRSRNQSANEYSRYRGMVRKGELIISKGSVVNDSEYQKLLSLRHFYTKDKLETSSSFQYSFGYLLLTFIVLGLYFWYIFLEFPKVMETARHLLFLLLLIFSYAYLVYLFDNTSIFSLYAIPFCIAPVLISNFYGARLALITHLAIIFIASYLSSATTIFTFTFLQSMAGLAAVLSRAGTRSWTRFFFALQYIFLAYFLSYIGLTLIREGSWQNIDWMMLKWLGLNVFLTLLANPLVPIVERVFGYTSDVTLIELSDLEHPLLKEMSIEAPGTLQHSLQVANLAEAAASAVGANSLLVRVAALYHDIGKMIEPTFYIENQMGESPHEGKTALESATIIIQHVTKGEKMARKHGLPSILIDFILTHHGTTRVEFFWQQHQQSLESIDNNDAAFRYPGPKPRTREEAILMLADSVEAAAKSLKNPNEYDINLIVDRIVSIKLNDGQLEDSTLTFKELEVVRSVFKKLLKSIYHVRIQYPNQ